MIPFEALVAMALVTALPALAAEPSPEGSGRRAFFGDLHLHTSYSMDAVILGGTLTTLDDAYRFAQGEAVDHRGQTLRLDRPLDFLAITDHAEQMGVGRDLYDETTPVGKSDLGRRFRERLGATTDELRALFQSKQPIPGVDTGPTVREAWQREMEAARSHYRPGSFSGVDPFAFGVVGASDVHNGWSDPREETYRGPDGAGELEREEVLELLGISKDEPAVISMLATGSGNLTGIWADENTRESLYDSLRRKETFATSGTRIVLRLFGGWSYEAGLLERRDWVAAATAGGVAMGSDLAARPPEAAAPRLAAWALMDPMGAKLERLQVVKVWLEGDAQAEKVFDVRVAGAGGAAELAALWQDPGFDPAQPTLYYLRVLEVPTPRWSTLLATQKGLPVPESVPATIRERAWSSPIWYRPGG